MPIEFKRLVKFAEEFIEINAKDILNKQRLSDDNTCKELIENKYKPMIVDIDKISIHDFKKAVVRRMCIQLQNYQRMPQALDYFSFGYSPEYDKKFNLFDDDNEIFQYIYKKINDKAETTKEEIYNKFSKYYDEKIYKDGKYNFALKKYSKGLADFLEEVRGNQNYFSDIKNYCIKLDRLAREGNFKEIKNVLNKFSKNIYYLNTALSYDFFKELACKNLVKPDVHIKEIFKRYIFKSPELPDIDTIACCFIGGCQTIQKSPYYVDKIFWLCCTGQFYKDGITINIMTRRNFFKFIEFKLNKVN